MMILVLTTEGDEHAVLDDSETFDYGSADEGGDEDFADAEDLEEEEVDEDSEDYEY